jgi:hypothetical protein
MESQEFPFGKFRVVRVIGKGWELQLVLRDGSVIELSKWEAYEDAVGDANFFYVLVNSVYEASKNINSVVTEIEWYKSHESPESKPAPANRSYNCVFDGPPRPFISRYHLGEIVGFKQNPAKDDFVPAVILGVIIKGCKVAHHALLANNVEVRAYSECFIDYPDNYTLPSDLEREGREYIERGTPGL